MSKPSVTQRRVTYVSRPPKKWYLLSAMFFGAAFAALALRILNEAHHFDGLFFISILLFFIGLFCACLQMDATEKWEGQL